MAKYIEGEKFKESIKELTSCMFSYEMTTGEIEDDFLELVDDEPAADVQEVKHGHWIPERDPDENNRIQCYHCSVCDDDFHYIGAFIATKYCPCCGARMDGDSE